MLADNLFSCQHLIYITWFTWTLSFSPVPTVRTVTPFTHTSSPLWNDQTAVQSLSIPVVITNRQHYSNWSHCCHPTRAKALSDKVNTANLHPLTKYSCNTNSNYTPLVSCALLNIWSLANKTFVLNDFILTSKSDQLPSIKNIYGPAKANCSFSSEISEFLSSRYGHILLVGDFDIYISIYNLKQYVSSPPRERETGLAGASWLAC